jgi:hypothetical protein
MAHQRYEDPDGRWAITVPAEWEQLAQQNSKLGTTDVMFFLTPAADPERWEQDPAVDVLAVTLMPGMTLPEAIEMWRFLLGDGAVDEVAHGARSLAGQPADEIVFDGAEDGVARRTRIATTSVGGALYLVTHHAARERYEAEERRVSAALDSFELLPGSAFAPAVLFDPDAEFEAHVQEVIERERQQAHANDPEPKPPHEGIAHKLGSLLHRGGR